MRYAVCNELFGSRDPFEAAAIVRDAGFSGVEFAPFTLFGDFSPTSFRSGLETARAALAAEGLTFAGFHWLLAAPPGLHATTPDRGARKAAWDQVARLAEAAGELGGGPLVFGSPRQRSSAGGATREEAAKILAEELGRIAPLAAAARSPVLLEALSSDQSDVVNTMAQARAICAAIGSPGVGCMFDFHNTGDETEDWESLVREGGRTILHVHANEPDGSCPRRGGADMGPAFKALRDIGFAGWVSVEIFDSPADPAAALRGAMDRFRDFDRELAPIGGA